MKSSTLTKSILAILLVLSIVLGMNVQTSSWKNFSFATRQWITAFSDLFHPPQIITDVKAFMGSYTSWPRSRKHKGFDGGWIMPFEIFQLKTNKYGSLTKEPITIDLNGDGLMDFMFSYLDFHYGASYGTASTWSLDQYIFLRKANGFVPAYTCKQVLDDYIYFGNPGSRVLLPHYWYYGDCADTSYTAVQDEVSLQEKISNPLLLSWSPPRIFLQQAILNWEGKRVPKYPGYNSKENITAGTTYSLSDLGDIGQRDRGYPYDEITYLRNVPVPMPRIMDLNGDNLPDLFFFGTYQDGTYQSTNVFRELKFEYVLMNTGQGFAPAHACVEAPYGNTNSLEPSFQLNGTLCY
jgi:hypothetical protein